MVPETAVGAEEFERAYAERSGLTVEELRLHRTVRPCHCESARCEGWQSVSHETARELDDEVQHHPRGEQS